MAGASKTGRNLLRLVAFALILAAIVEKNRKE